MPEDFGSIALVQVFVTFSNVLVVTGFSTSIIQKKKIDETEISSIFYCSFALAIILYIVLFLSAPFIAIYYKQPGLSQVLRVIALVLPFGAYNSIQSALLVRRMDFKIQFFCCFIAVTIAGMVGVFLAFKGLGIWAIVAYNISNTIIISIMYSIIVRWRPLLYFSKTKVLILLSFGWKITVSAIIDTLYTNLFTLAIGKKYSTKDLAYYNRGQQLPLLLSRNVTSSISTVMLPVFSQLQDKKIELKSAVRNSVSLCSFVMFPIIMGLLACSRPLVLLLYSEKWIEAVPYMQLFCIAYMFYPINMANTQALNGMGRSDLFLKLNAIKKGLGILVLVFLLPYGVKTITLGYAATSIISVLINIAPNRKLLSYGYFEQLKDVMPSLILSVSMCAICLLLAVFIKNTILLLAVQVVTGMVFYLGLAHLFKVQAMGKLLMIFKDLLASLVK